MDTLAKISVWVVVLILAGGHFNELVQTSMVDAGIITKPIQVKDACKLKILPTWIEQAIGCEKEKPEKPKSSKLKLNLNLGGDVLKKYKFENREKSLSESLTETINKAFVYVQRLILPEKFVMPCLVGDCDMDKKIKMEKKEYSNLFHKKVSITPEESEKQKPKITLPNEGT